MNPSRQIILDWFRNKTEQICRHGCNRIEYCVTDSCIDETKHIFEIAQLQEEISNLKTLLRQELVIKS